MTKIVFSIAIAILAAGPAFATCKSDATDKKLAGAALNSFMKKCESDAKAKCEADSAAKKLAGAAKKSMPTAVKRLGVEAIIAVLRKAGGDPPTEVGREFGGAIKALNFTNEGPPLGQQVIGELLPAVQIVDVLGVNPPPDDGWHGLDKRVLLSRGREVESSVATSSPVSECENR